MGKRRKRQTKDEIGFHERFLFKAGSKLLFGILVVVIILTFVQCSIEKPEAPEWTTSLTIPLLNRTFPMEELIEKIDQDGINIDGKGNITFTVNAKELDTIYLNPDYMTTEDISLSMFRSIGIPATLQGYIPPTILKFSRTLELVESDHIDSISINSGSLELTLINWTSVPITLEVDIPDLLQDEHQYSIRDTLAAREQSTISTSLSNHMFILSDQTVPQAISINATAYIEGTAPGDSVLITNVDGFTVDASLTSMTFSSISGILTCYEMTFDSIIVDIDIPKGFNEIGLSSADLTLEIDNVVDIPSTFDLQFSGNNDKSLFFSEDIPARGSLATSVNLFTKSTDILYPFPDTISISGTVQFGDGITEGTIRAEDFIASRVWIHAPLEMIIGLSEIDTDIKGEEIDQTDIDAITNHVEQLGFVYHIFNHLPIGARIEILLSSDSATLYTDPEVVIGPITVPPASVVDSIGVAVDTSSTGEQTIVLTNENIRVLENDTLYVGTKMALQETKEKIVKLTTDDFITVIGRFEIEYHFDN